MSLKSLYEDIDRWGEDNLGFGLDDIREGYQSLTPLKELTDEGENYVRTSDFNPVLDAADNIRADYKEFKKSKDYEALRPSTKKALDEKMKEINANLGSEGLKYQQKNADEALAADALLKQQIAADTYDALKNNPRFSGGGLDQIEAAADWASGQIKTGLMDTVNSAGEFGLNSPEKILSAIALGLGDTEDAEWLAQHQMDSQSALGSIIGGDYSFLGGDRTDTLRAGANAVTNMAMLIGATQPQMKLIEGTMSGLGKVTGLTKLAQKMYGVADASELAAAFGIDYSTAEGVAAAGQKLMETNRLFSLNYGKGLVGLVTGKTLSAIPTAITMSIPELYGNHLKYDSLGNAVLPDRSQLATIALTSIPHAIVENFGINPQTFGREAAERLGFKDWLVKSFKNAFGEGVEEIVQGFFSLIDKNWGEKDPITGKTIDLTHAIDKAMYELADDNNKGLKDMAEEFIGGAVGGFFMNAGQEGLWKSKKQLEMFKQYEQTLDNISKGIDIDAANMEKMGIADFSVLREERQKIDAIGQQIKDLTDKINANDYKDSETTRSEDIVKKATLEKAMEVYEARLTQAAEVAGLDYQKGFEILGQMQADYAARQQAAAAAQMQAQNAIDTTEDPAQLSAAYEALKNNQSSDQSMEDAAESGNFDTEQYQPKINEAIKTFKHQNQQIDEMPEGTYAEKKLKNDIKNNAKHDKGRKLAQRTNDELLQLMAKFEDGDISQEFIDWYTEKYKDGSNPSFNDFLEWNDIQDSKAAEQAKEINTKVEDLENQRDAAEKAGASEETIDSIDEEINKVKEQQPAPEGWHWVNNFEGNQTLEKDSVEKMSGKSDYDTVKDIESRMSDEDKKAAADIDKAKADLIDNGTGNVTAGLNKLNKQAKAILEKYAQTDEEKQVLDRMIKPAKQKQRLVKNEKVESPAATEADNNYSGEALKDEAEDENTLYEKLSDEDKDAVADANAAIEEINGEIAENEKQLADMEEGSDSYKQVQQKIADLKQELADNQKDKDKILDKVRSKGEALKTKAVPRHGYTTSRNAILAAARELKRLRKEGKVGKDVKMSDYFRVYGIGTGNWGFTEKQKSTKPSVRKRTTTREGKEAVDKTIAQKITEKVNAALEKAGRKTRVTLVEDFNELQEKAEDTDFSAVRVVTYTNPVTGLLTRDLDAIVVEGVTEGENSERQVFIVRNNIDSEDRLKEVINHELLHAAVGYFFDSNNEREYNYLMHNVQRLLKNGELREYLHDMSEYDSNSMTGLEEVLSRIAEVMDDKPKTFSKKVRAIWNNIVAAIYKAMRYVGLTDKLHKSEVVAMIKNLRTDFTQTGDLYHNTKGYAGVLNNTKDMFATANIQKAMQKMDKEGKVVTFDKINGNALFSLRTWFGDENGQKSGRKVLQNYLKECVAKGEISSKDAKAMISEMDSIAKACELMKEEYPEFSAWSDTGVDYDSQGKPYFTVVRQNGDYAMNIDFSTVCKKRRALNNVLNEIVKRGYLTEHGDLTKKDVVDIQEAIKQHNFEVACALCFVDSKRYNIGNQAKNIVGKWNKMYKSFVEGTDYYKEHLEKALARLADGKKAKNQEQRIALAINSDEKDADGNYKYRRELTADWLISSGSREMIGGHDNLAKNYPRIFEVLNGYGSGKSKNSHMDVAWNNDIINAFAATNNPNVTNFDPVKAKSIGGVRIQSFSDFIPTMFFDYVQCISELAAKKLTSHCYTKEADFIKLFGSCGIKTNMSLVYAEDGCREISKTEYDKIAKKKGEAFVTSYTDKKGKAHYFEYLYTDIDPKHPQSFDPTEAFRLRNDPRFIDNCGTIAVGVSDQHVRAMLNDSRIDMVIPYHKSGIAKEVAIMRQIYNYKDYTSSQTERDKVTGYLINDKNKKHQAALKESGAYGKHFDFYGDLEKTKDPRKTAKNYLKWCDENKLTPKFVQFAGEDNYYKLLADFKLYKQDKNGKEVYVPQQEVKLNLADDWQQTLASALDVNQKVADRFAEEIDGLCEECKSILATNKAELNAGKKKGKKSAKPKVTKDTKIKSVTKAKSKKNSVMLSLRTSEIDKQLTPAQFKNRDKNNAAKPMGNLVTLQGSAIKRYKGIVGKEVSGQIYVHKNYASEVIPSDLLSKAENIIKSAKPEFKYNCVMYDKNKNTIRFDEADNFDTAPEPIPANTVTVDLNSGKVSKQDYISKIWHHKWLWVKDDYKGFDVNESWERSRNWLNGIANLNLDKTHPDYSIVNRGIANGAANGYGAWNAQLRYFGLDNLIDEENNVLPANAPKANSKTRYSLRSVEPVYPSDSSWYRGKTLQEYKKLGYPIYETVPADVLSEEQRKAIKSKGGASGTANTSTKTTYTKLFTWLKEQHPDSWQNMRILDASSGLGQGTVIGQDMGFNVTDIEPFVSDTKYGRKAGDRPAYEDYDKLEKDIESGKIEKFDFIISNAVLNVLPQDERDNMTTALSHLVKDGGQIFFNVISKDYQTAKDAKEPVGRNDKGQPYWQLSKSGNPTGSNLVTEANGDTGREIFVWSSNSPQKVFSKPELTAYLKDVMGDNITVSTSPKGIGMTAVVVTKGQPMFSLKTAHKDYLKAVENLGSTEELKTIFNNAKKNNTLGKAPNGKKSNLEPAQWLTVRTKQFKDWFGDWEKAYKRNYLETIDAKTIDVGAFVKDEGKSIQDSAIKYFDGSKLYKTAVGIVEIDERSARDSLAHRYGQKKLDILTSLQTDFAKAVYLNSKEDFKGNLINNHYFAYPVIYNGNRELVFCRAREDNNKNRLYVHEVFTESEIKKDNTLQTVASANNMVELRGGIVLYKNILKDIYKVNQNETSKVVDENGEPLIVHHGTENGGHYEFDAENFARSEPVTWFDDNNKVAYEYARNWESETFDKDEGSQIYSCFLNMRNPIIIEANGKNYMDIQRDLYRAANDKTHDGIIVHNIKDNRWSEDYYPNGDEKAFKGISNTYAVHNSEQIKLADAKTTDYANNTIPINQRFNPEKKDIRYSLKTLDTEYEEALKTDRKKAERMLIEAADRAGFYYEGWHTSPKKFNIFEDGHRGKPWEFSIDTLSPVGWFSMEKQDGVKYGSNEYHVFLKIKNPYIISWFNANREEALKRKAEWLRLSEEVNKANPDDRRSYRAKRMEMISAKDAYEKYIERYEPFEVMRQEAKKVFESGKYPSAKTWGEALRMKLQEEGFDAVELDGTIADNNTDAQWIIPFTGGENIKSAELITRDDADNVIPLSKRFDRSNKDIRFSLKTNGKSYQQMWHEQQANFAKKIEEKRAADQAEDAKGMLARAADYLDKAEYNFADRGFYLKQWQTEIENTLSDDPNLADIFDNGKLKEKYDAKMLLDTMHGRIQTKRDEFQEKYWNPIQELAKKNKVTYNDLNRYLFARHADERDKYIASINPEFANGGHGSGWQDSWGTPAEVIAQLEKKYGSKVMQKLGNDFDAMNNALIDQLVEYHLMSKNTAQMIRTRYKHYTPLKRFDDAERAGNDSNPAELNVGQNLNARAYGRTSEPEHMLTFAKANIDTVFRKGEKNLCKMAMLNLALRLADNNIQVNRQLIKRTLDRHGDVAYVMDRTSDKEQTIFVRKGDNTFNIHFNNKELYDAFTSDDATEGIVEAMVHALRGLTATMGANATSRNIEFGLVNMDKDQQQALAENLIYRSKKGGMWHFAKAAIKNIPSAAKTFIKHSLAGKYGFKADADTKMFDEFLRNGGSTGYIDIYRLIDDAKDLERQMDEDTLKFMDRWAKWKAEGRLTEAMKMQAKEWVAKVMKPLELINDLFEQTTRFSNYKAARQAGMSPARAAELSKNLTLNFNRHGAMWTAKYNWAYMFSNASLQGTTKTVRMYQQAFSKKATPESRKAARWIMGASFAAGIMSQILNHAFGGDDDDELKYYDKLDSSIKDNNIIIMNPADSSGKNYIKLPLFVGAAFPYMIGRNVAATIMGTQSAYESTANIVGNMEDYFSPLGAAADNKEGQGGIVKRLAPTAFRPFLDVSYNSNFAGSRIYANSYGSNKPAYTRAFDRTPAFYVELSRLLGKISGGNELEKGKFDVAPEAIQHLVESYTGGTGKFFGRGIDFATKVLNGEEVNAGNIPIIRRFTDDVGESYVYDEYAKIDNVYRAVTAAKESKNEEVLEKYPEHRKLINLMSRYRTRINKETDPKKRTAMMKEVNRQGRKYISEK